MHRANFNKRQKLVLRIFSYFVICVLSVITTALLLYIALGYRLDSDGTVVRSGLLLADSKPVSSEVYINGINKEDPTQSRFVLPAGTYDLELKREGYFSWKNTALVEASSVRNIYYPLLIPEKFTAKPSVVVDDFTSLTQSDDRKRVLIASKDKRQLELVELGSQPKISSLALPADFLVSGTLGDLTVIEWAQDDRHVLVRQRVGKVESLLVIDTSDPQSSVNISEIFPEDSMKNAKFVFGSSNVITAINGSVLKAYDSENDQSRVIKTRVLQYEPLNEGTFSFVGSSSSGAEFEAGVISGSESVVVHRAPLAKGAPRSTMLKYDNNQYLAVWLPGEKTTTVYSNPLARPILSEQLPFVKLPLADATLLESPDSQFLLAVKNDQVSVYDFEYSEKTQFKLPKNAQDLRWVRSHQMTFNNGKNFYIVDFDGKNRYELPKGYGLQVFFDNGFENISWFLKSGTQIRLQSAPLSID